MIYIGIDPGAKERTVRGLGRAQLKLKSMKFLEKEGKE